MSSPYHTMEPEHLVYWLERAKAEMADRDILIQNQRNEMERLTRSLQEVSYNSCMQNAIISYEVQRFAVSNMVSVPINNPALGGGFGGGGGAVPMVKLSDLEGFLAQLTGGILQQSSAAVASSAGAAVTGAGSSRGASPRQGGGGHASSSAAISTSQGANQSSTAAMPLVANPGAAVPVVTDTMVLSHNQRLAQMQQRYAKRCRDDAESDMRPVRPGQWNIQQQDVQ